MLNGQNSSTSFRWTPTENAKGTFLTDASTFIIITRKTTNSVELLLK